MKEEQKMSVAVFAAVMFSMFYLTSLCSCECASEFKTN